MDLHFCGSTITPAVFMHLASGFGFTQILTSKVKTNPQDSGLIKLCTQIFWKTRLNAPILKYEIATHYAPFHRYHCALY